MTSIFVIYKIRYQQNIQIFARLIEAYYDKEKCQRAVIGYTNTLSTSEKNVGWGYWMEQTEIMDQLETSPE
jgi:hypothetical protein